MNPKNQQTLNSRDACHNLPSVSVIIPARNAEATIVTTLDGVLSQDYAGPVEIIVIDDSDTPVMSEMIRRSYPSVRLLSNPKRGLISGANLGFRMATGDILMRCDAHTTFSPGYMKCAIETLERTGAANVGGRQLAVGTTLFERAVALAMTTLLGVGGARHRLGGAEGPVDTAFLGTFWRETLDELGGGYATTVIRNEDYELNYRMRKQGKIVWFNPELVAEYRPRSTPWALAQQYFNYGRGKSTILWIHPASVRFRHLAAPGLVLALVAGAGVALAGIPWLITAVLFTYALVIVVGSVIVGFRRRDAAAILLPLALVIMHLSWGIGCFFWERTGRARFRAIRTWRR